MAEIGSAWISVVPSAAGFGKKLESSVSGEVSGSGKKLGSGFGKAFAIAGGAALAGGALLGGFLKGAADEAREAAVIGARTENVIKKMGNAAGISAKQVGDLAASISSKTGVDDEAIQSGQNLLLTFGNIRNEAGKGNDIFNQTSRLMVDMSAAMGTDAKGSAIQLGKALNDPVKGLTALSRVGVSFTEQQKEQIKALVASGDTMSAQKVILGELERQFGGAAESMATPAAKASVAWGNFKEQIGTLVLPLVDRLLNAFLRAMPTITAAIDGIGPAFARIKTAVAPVIAFVQRLFTSFQGSGAASAHLQQFATTAATAWTSIKSVFASAVAIVTVLWQNFGSTIVRFASSTFANVLQIVRGAFKILQGLFNVIAGILKGDWSRAWTGIKQIASGAMTLIGGVVKQGLNVIRTAFSAAVTVLRGLWNRLWDGIKAAASAAWSAIKSIVASGVARVVAAMNGIAVLVGKVRAWFADILNAIRSRLGEAVGFVQSIPGKMIAALAGLGARFYAAGAEAMNMLASGIRDRFSAAWDAMKSAASKLASLIPGSPVKEGPLKSLNKGHAGGEIMRMIAKGIGDNANRPAEAMKRAVEKVREQLTRLRDATKQALSEVRQEFRSIRDSVAQAFTGDLFSGATMQDLQGALAGSLTNIRDAREAFAWLEGKLPKDFLSDLFASGNTALIDSLARADTMELAQLTSRLRSQQNAARGLGRDVGRNETERQTDRLVAKLDRVERAIDRVGPNVSRAVNGGASTGRRDRRR